MTNLHALRDRQQDDGFTFVEMLTVMLIIGVLATLAIPSFFSVRERAWHAASKSDARNMTKYYTNLVSNGVYATTVAELKAEGFDPTADVQHGLCAAQEFGFAVATRHAAADEIWIIDYQGRFQESGAATIEDALNGLAECAAGGNAPDVD